MVVSNAAIGKSEQIVERSDTDRSMEYIGLILYVFFIMLTLVMAITLALFAIGFFMAVTHWCDRLATSIIFLQLQLITIITSSFV